MVSVYIDQVFKRLVVVPAINKMKRVLERSGSCTTDIANICVWFLAFKEEEPGAHDRVLCRRC